MSKLPFWLPRLGLVIAGLAAWFTTQWLLGRRGFPDHGISDGMFMLLAPIHQWLMNHPAGANTLLIVSSGIIDLLGIFLLVSAIFGPTVRPFMGLLMLFALRQLCQMLCALPAPDGLIWHDPGFPSLLVTYGVSNDFFFSGHTSIAVLGAAELARLNFRGSVWLGTAIAIFEALTVLSLRAHYTMDIYAGAVTALLVVVLADRAAPPVDRFLSRHWRTGSAASQTRVN